MELTSIQVSKDLLEELKKRKMHDKESYDDVIWDALEDSMELSEETKKAINKAEKEFKDGKVHTLEEVELKLSKQMKCMSRH